MIKKKSLKKELNRWIIITALFFVLLGTGIAGVVAFKQARELQDHTLLEIASLIKAKKLKESRMIHHDIEKETIIINDLGEKQHAPIIPITIKNGFHTLELDNLKWRVLVISQPNSSNRYSVAQQTKLRDDIALRNSLSVLLPLLFLVVIMLLIIHYVINRQFHYLSKLAKLVDKQDGRNPQSLADTEIPIEIAPFVNSINGLLARVRSTLQKQQRFIADASHELRTPITALSLQVENLSSAQNNDNQDTHQLQTSINRLQHLVAQLLDLARIQNDLPSKTEVVSISQIVKDNVASLFPLAEAKSIDLGVVKHTENLMTMDAHGRLSQLIYNAIDNAIKYTLEGGKVDISLYQHDKEIIFIVEDTGIGIPDNELSHVKEPFYRVNETHVSGNGLGLAISYEIANQLGGSILMKNREKNGLSFRYIQLAV